MNSPILAPNGRPAREQIGYTHPAAPPQPKAYGWSLYATPRSTGQMDSYRQRSIYLGGSLDYELNGYNWRELLSYSRQLFAQLGNLGGALVQKATYAVGESWKPQFYGEDQEWGDQAEEWLSETFYPVADVRGGGFDFTTNLFLDSLALDVDGDAAMILTSADSGFPQVMFVPSDRISGTEKEIQKGRFKGNMLVNGCILNNDGRVIGYRVYNTGMADFEEYSTSNCQLLFEPEWQGQRRGVPRIARVLMDWFDIQDINAFLKRGVKLDASQGIIHKTETGTGDTSSTGITPNTDVGTTDTDLRIEQREGGEILYLKAGSGETIESFSSDRPHPNTEAFVRRLERAGLLAVGWFYELIDPSGIGGASVRLIQDQARNSIRYRQKTIRKRARRAVTYAVAMAMKNGFLPKNSGDWWKWNFELPAQITVDEGYSRQAEIEDYKLGFQTKAGVTQSRGKFWKDQDKQRDQEFDALLTRAKAHADKFNLPMDYVLDRLEQRNPNPPTIAQDLIGGKPSQTAPEKP